MLENIPVRPQKAFPLSRPRLQVSVGFQRVISVLTSATDLREKKELSLKRLSFQKVSEIRFFFGASESSAEGLLMLSSGNLATAGFGPAHFLQHAWLSTKREAELQLSRLLSGVFQERSRVWRVKVTGAGYI